MNAFGFLGLLRRIYGKKLPDLQAIQDQGLLAVKIAQHFALRIDFLDEDVCHHLSKLYRSTTPESPEDVDRLISLHAGDGWLDNFESFDRTPLASASIGQVHRARTTDGDDVIVKIIKKDHRARFIRDIRSLRRLFRVLLFFYPKLRKVFDPMGVIDHIEDYTLAELDLNNEMAGQDTLRRLADESGEGYDLSLLKFPKLYRDLSGTGIMVAEEVRGTTFDELLTAGKLPYEQLLQLFHVHGYFLFGPGTFHGDLHPGNAMLGDDGNMYFIDTGAVSTIGPKIKDGLYNFFTALAWYDYPECARYLNEMAEKEISGPRFDRFREKLIALYADFTDATVSQVSLTRRMMETIKLGVHSGMEFEKGMFAIIKSMMYLDGMVLRCNPDAVLMKDMRPFISEMNELRKR